MYQEQLAKLTTDKDTRVSILAAIPCYNTQDSVAGVVLCARKYVNKVVVINDGSTDNTGNVAAKAGAVVLNHSENKGYGQAIQSCFEAARKYEADLLVIIDGDGQHEPNEIPQLINPILRKEADLVIGSRFLNKDNSVPAFRKFGINFINFLWNAGSKLKISDTQSGFRAYNKKIVEEISLEESGMCVSIEILEKVRDKGLSIFEVPISCSYKNNGSSPTLKSLRQGIGVALSVIKIRMKNKHISVRLN